MGIAVSGPSLGITICSYRRDLIADGRATVTVMQNDFKSMADARGTVTGTFETVPDDERKAARDAYMKVLSAPHKCGIESTAASLCRY